MEYLPQPPSKSRLRRVLDKLTCREDPITITGLTPEGKEALDRISEGNQLPEHLRGGRADNSPPAPTHVRIMTGAEYAEERRSTMHVVPDTEETRAS